MAGLSEYDPGSELSSIDFSGMIGGPLDAIVKAQATAAMSSVNFIKEVGFEPDIIDDNGVITDVGKPVYVSFKYPKEVTPYQPAVLGGDIASVTISSAGTGYTTGDVLDVSGGTNGAVRVTSVDADGKITEVSIVNGGSDYNSGTADATGGAGAASGAELNISVTQAADAIPAEVIELELKVPIITMMPIPFITIDEGTINFNAKINSMENGRTDTSFNIGGSFEAGGKWGGKRSNYGYAKLKVNASYKKDTTKGFKINKTYHLGVNIKVSQAEMPEGMEKLLNILEGAITSQPPASST